ncbi:hypothetical protein ACVXZ4_04050 [Lacisediminihabitans sp. FW035]
MSAAMSVKKLVANALAARHDADLPKDATMTEPLRNALATLTSSRDLRAELGRIDEETIAFARSQRARWDEIALVTGTTISSARKRWGNAPSSVEARLSHAKAHGDGEVGLSMKDAAEVLGATIPSLHNWINDAITVTGQKSVRVERLFNGASVAFTAQNEPLGTHRRQWRITEISNHGQK